MRSITVYFEDKEFEKLKEVKKETSWHDFICQLAENNTTNKNNEKEKKGG